MFHPPSMFLKENSMCNWNISHFHKGKSHRDKDPDPGAVLLGLATCHCSAMWIEEKNNRFTVCLPEAQDGCGPGGLLLIPSWGSAGSTWESSFLCETVESLWLTVPLLTHFLSLLNSCHFPFLQSFPQAGKPQQVFHLLSGAHNKSKMPFFSLGPPLSSWAAGIFNSHHGPS